MKPRIYLDPNEPTGGGVAPAAAPAAPTATQHLPGAAPAPAAPPPAPVSGGDLVRLPDGSVMKVSDVQELAKRPTLSSQEREQFELFKRVTAGDPAAIAQAAGLSSAPAAPAALSAPTSSLTPEQLTALQEQVNAANQKLAAMETKMRVVDNIETIRQEAFSRSIGADVIKQGGEYTPALAQWIKSDDSIAADVGRSILEGRRMATEHLKRPMTPDEQNKIDAQILMMREQQAAGVLKIGGWKPPEFKRAGPIDNQPDRRPGQPNVLRMVNGQLVDGMGRVYQPDSSGNFIEIPQRIPGVGAPGTSLSPDSGTRNPNAPISRQTMMQQMRAEVEARNIQEQ